MTVPWPQTKRLCGLKGRSKLICVKSFSNQLLRNFRLGMIAHTVVAFHLYSNK